MTNQLSEVAAVANIEYINGLEKAIDVIGNEWKSHSDNAETIIDNESKCNDFYREMAICGVLNNLMKNLGDLIEEEFNVDKDAV